MKLPWIKRHTDLDLEGTLLDGGDERQEPECLPPEQRRRVRSNGLVYPDSLDEVRERPPWTLKAWSELDEILNGAMTDEVKLRLATDVADFVGGNFYSEITPAARQRQIAKFEALEQTLNSLIVLLRNDKDIRSLNGSGFSDSLAKQLDRLALYARAAASVKRDEAASFKKKPRGNTLVQNALLRHLTEHFLATGHKASRTRAPDRGTRKGMFADYLHHLWKLLPEGKKPSKTETFIRRGYDVARRMGGASKAAKRRKRSA